MQKLFFYTKSNYPKLKKMIGMTNFLGRFTFDFVRRLQFYGDSDLKLSAPDNILLYGAPGCGKTLLAETLCQHSGLPYAHVNYSILAPANRTETIKHLQDIEVQSLENAPALLIIHDIDCVLPNRETIKDVSYFVEVGLILSWVKSLREKNVWTIALSNRPQDIDVLAGTAQYFGNCYYVPYPESALRGALIIDFLAQRNVAYEGDVRELEKESNNMTCSDLLKALDDAFLQSLCDQAPLTQQMIKKHINKQKRPLSAKLEKKYKYIHELLESDLQEKDKIGF